MGREGGRGGSEGGRDTGRGGMTVIHIIMTPQYLNKNQVTECIQLACIHS